MRRLENDPAELGNTAPLAAVRGDLAALEVLEWEVAARAAALRALLSPEHARLVWALRDAEQRLALADQDLREHALVDEVARHLPEHATTVRAIAARLLGED